MRAVPRTTAVDHPAATDEAGDPGAFLIGAAFEPSRARRAPGQSIAIAENSDHARVDFGGCAIWQCGRAHEKGERLSITYAINRGPVTKNVRPAQRSKP
jgi:hypothetical protein